MTFLAISISFVIYYYKMRKRKVDFQRSEDDQNLHSYKCFRQQETNLSPNMKWKTNRLYSSQASEMECHDENIYPDWLMAREEMVFYSSQVERREKLGSGNYGSVYKGQLTQGKAV